jgi:hypothetical protein
LCGRLGAVEHAAIAVAAPVGARRRVAHALPGALVALLARGARRAGSAPVTARSARLRGVRLARAVRAAAPVRARLRVTHALPGAAALLARRASGAHPAPGAAQGARLVHERLAGRAVAATAARRAAAAARPARARLAADARAALRAARPAQRGDLRGVRHAGDATAAARRARRRVARALAGRRVALLAGRASAAGRAAGPALRGRLRGERYARVAVAAPVRARYRVAHALGSGARGSFGGHTSAASAASAASISTSAASASFVASPGGTTPLPSTDDASAAVPSKLPSAEASRKTCSDALRQPVTRMAQAPPRPTRPTARKPPILKQSIGRLPPRHLANGAGAPLATHDRPCAPITDVQSRVRTRRPPPRNSRWVARGERLSKSAARSLRGVAFAVLRGTLDDLEVARGALGPAGCARAARDDANTRDVPSHVGAEAATLAAMPATRRPA